MWGTKVLKGTREGQMSSQKFRIKIHDTGKDIRESQTFNLVPLT